MTVASNHAAVDHRSRLQILKTFVRFLPIIKNNLRTIKKFPLLSLVLVMEAVFLQWTTRKQTVIMKRITLNVSRIRRML